MTADDAPLPGHKHTMHVSKSGIHLCVGIIPVLAATPAFAQAPFSDQRSCSDTTISRAATPPAEFGVDTGTPRLAQLTVPPQRSLMFTRTPRHGLHDRRLTILPDSARERASEPRRTWPWFALGGAMVLGGANASRVAHQPCSKGCASPGVAGVVWAVPGAVVGSVAGVIFDAGRRAVWKGKRNDTSTVSTGNRPSPP